MEGKDGWEALGWYGMVWLALLLQTIPSPLAPRASVRTFMRGLFVLSRQAQQ